MLTMKMMIMLLDEDYGDDEYNDVYLLLLL
jgi:hypothetical protein